MNPSTWPLYYKNDDPALKLVPAFSQARRLHGTADRDHFTVRTIPADPGYVAVKPFCVMQQGGQFTRRCTFGLHAGAWDNGYADQLTLTTDDPVLLLSGQIVDLGDCTAVLVGEGAKFEDGADGSIHILEPGTYWWTTSATMP